MNSFKASLVALLLLSSFFSTAKEVTDTLYSAPNDRIIVTYSLTQKGNKVDLEFKSVRKLLGDQHRRKYNKEADRVHTLFFDWIGVRKDMEFSGEITPSAISLPMLPTRARATVISLPNKGRRSHSSWKPPQREP